jgi:hypothetical protein
MPGLHSELAQPADVSSYAMAVAVAVTASGFLLAIQITLTIMLLPGVVVRRFGIRL